MWKALYSLNKVYQEVVSGACNQSEHLCLSWLWLQPVVLPAWCGSSPLGWQLHSESGSEQYVQLTKQDQTSKDNWLHLCGNGMVYFSWTVWAALEVWQKLACLVLFLLHPYCSVVSAVVHWHFNQRSFVSQTVFPVLKYIHTVIYFMLMKSEFVLFLLSLLSHDDYECYKTNYSVHSNFF